MTALERAISNPPSVRGLESRSPVDGLQRRSVGFIDVFAQSVSAVAPSAAATTIPLIVTVTAGGATMWSLAIAMLLSLLVATTVNVFAKRIAATGSLYTFVSKGLGTGAAFVTGVALLIGYGFIAMFALAGAGYYLSILLHRFWPGMPSSTGVVSALLVCMAVVCVVVLVRGIHLSTRVTLIVESASVATILILVGVLLSQLGPTPDWAVLGLDASPEHLAVGSVLAVTAFVGFESSSTLGVEARRPFASIPRSLVWTVVGAGLLFLITSYSQLAGFAALGEDITATRTPINDLALAFGVEWMGLLLDLSVAASFLACAIASITAFSRVVFSMGREGVLPSRLGTTHGRFRTPHVAIIAALAIVTPVSVLALVLTGGAWAAMQVLIVVAAAGYITAYVLVCIAAPAFLWRIGELTLWPLLRAVVAGVLLSVALVVYLVVESAGERGVGVWVFLVTMALGISIWAIRHRRRPWLSSTVGVYDETVSADVLGGPSAEHR
ncbi:APC family permease [uncultured Plantibacter sp.]|uniref:APC family permease n=1 Tax=uncultured Plantibacter sp. TaxID=293337 RepID=UPI0028D33815|nr:APC family permease [uncultured Plantibacter sp.]